MGQKSKIRGREVEGQKLSVKSLKSQILRVRRVSDQGSKRSKELKVRFKDKSICR